MIYDANKLIEEHPKESATKVITLTKCWSVKFNTNGNAPADALVASFASKPLADAALNLFAMAKEDDASIGIVVEGVYYSSLPTFSVEGYDFDTYYEVVEDWQESAKIMTSLAQLSVMCDHAVETDLPNGVFHIANDDG